MDKDSKNDEMLFFPRGIYQRFAIDVYLPKNLINHGLLIELLAETLGFDEAKQYLLKNAPSVLRELDYRDRDKENKENVEFYPIGQAVPPKLTPNERKTRLRSRLRGLENQIEGYSIFEVDGAFADRSRGRAVPIFRPRPHRIVRELNDPKAGSDRWWLHHLKKTYNFGPDGWSLNRDPSLPQDQFRRVLVHRDNSHRLVRIDSTNPNRLLDHKCIHLLEERTLVIRFLVPLGVRRVGRHFLPMHGDDVHSEHLKVIWDALLVIGSYFVRELGRRGGIEDQIWISYDLGCLWKWKKGEPFDDWDKKRRKTRNRISEGDTPIWAINQ
jgi:hypothetical protein